MTTKTKTKTAIRKALYGKQEPTFQIVGEYDYSMAEVAVPFFERRGVRFTPYQKYELTLYFARVKADGETDDYAGSTICISRPRQTGKSFAARFYALWCAMIEGKSVLYTCQNGDTATAMFDELKKFIQDNKDIENTLLPKHKGIKEAPISRGFYFSNGGYILLRTRTESLNRGRSVDVIICDEAMYLTSEQLEAISATNVATDYDSQTIAIGSPSGPKHPVDGMFRLWHDEAHAGEETDDPIWWLEWGIDYVPDDINDPDLWYTYNPAMGYRITEKKMRNKAKELKSKPESFAREFLGYWSILLTAKSAISESQWKRCAISPEDAAELRGTPTYAVKFSPDGAVGSIAVCLRADDDTKPLFVELVENVDMSVGVSFFADWVEARYKQSSKVVIDGAANSATLIQMLKDRKVPVKKYIMTPTASQMASACSTFYNDIQEKSVTHAGHSELTESVLQCKKRKIGNSGGWGFQGVTEDVDASITEAAALAVYGATITKPKKKRKRRKVGY